MSIDVQREGKGMSKVHDLFNEAHGAVTASSVLLDTLSNTLIHEHADPTYVEEVNDLIRDAQVLRRRIDRLHHDLAHAEIETADRAR
jgi:hypothetical protein